MIEVVSITKPHDEEVPASYTSIKLTYYENVYHTKNVFCDFTKKSF